MKEKFKNFLIQKRDFIRRYTIKNSFQNANRTRANRLEFKKKKPFSLLSKENGSDSGSTRAELGQKPFFKNRVFTQEKNSAILFTEKGPKKFLFFEGGPNIVQVRVTPLLIKALLSKNNKKSKISCKVV